MCVYVLRERRRRLRGEGLCLYLLWMFILKVDVKWCVLEIDLLEFYNCCFGVLNVEIFYKLMIFMFFWYR